MPGFDLQLGRHVGLTHVIDKGLGPRAWEDILEVAGDHISIVKLGWGTAYVTRNLERKLEVLRDKPVVIGGTFFEVVYAARASSTSTSNGSPSSVSRTSRSPTARSRSRASASSS